MNTQKYKRRSAPFQGAFAGAAALVPDGEVVGMTPQNETPHRRLTAAPDFPNFYLECAFTDGRCDVRDGTDRTACYTRLGQPDPLAMEWYQRGVTAYQAPEISA